jgi:hypothetical protein
MEGFDSRMHSSDIDFKVHEEIKVGEIIAKFDISGRDRSWQDYCQIRYLAKFGQTPNIEYGTSDKGQTVPPSNRESHSLKFFQLEKCFLQIRNFLGTEYLLVGQILRSP